MMGEIGYNKCYLCNRIIESFTRYHDYHKGYYNRNHKTLYPFEKKRFSFPEGNTYEMAICQDCLDEKGIPKIIKKLRIERINQRIGKNQRQITRDESTIEDLTNRIFSNKENAKRLQEYLESIENDTDPEYEWSLLEVEGDRW